MRSGTFPDFTGGGGGGNWRKPTADKHIVLLSLRNHSKISALPLFLDLEKLICVTRNLGAKWIPRRVSSHQFPPEPVISFLRDVSSLPPLPSSQGQGSEVVRVWRTREAKGKEGEGVKLNWRKSVRHHLGQQPPNLGVCSSYVWS